MGQMTQALGYSPRATPACLAIFSVAQSLARVAAGAVSESALTWPTQAFGLVRGGVPRTAFMVLSCALAVAGHGVLAYAAGQRQRFVLGIMLMGLSFGGLWPLMVLIMGDLFGTVNHGANYMFADGFTCAVGTLSMAKYLTQTIYQAHVSPSDDFTTTTTTMATNACYGEACFQQTHQIIAVLCLVSLMACLVLLYMTRSSYGVLLGA